MKQINKLVSNLEKALEESDKALKSATELLTKIEKKDKERIEKKLQSIDILHTIWLHKKEGIND
tara:strand:- start:94 stop:285 length:192 start_codon:yes stop_codon:yes gene_type:complete